MDHMALYVRQSVVPAGVSIRQLLMIQSHEMQNCGMQVVHVNSIFDRRAPKLICGPPGNVSPDSASGKPCCKTIMIMVSALLAL